ncbi:MAG TPA: hypothetical protein VNL74_05295 [Methylococcus sp.]|nr:hypothetical protein [Methylococcus sp.]
MAKRNALTEMQRRRARDLLEQALAKYGSYQAIASLLGISRAAVSTVRRGVYPGDDTNVLRAVLRRFSRVECPYLKRDLDPDECRSIHSAPAPSHNPLKMEHWRACRGCPHRGRWEYGQE